MIPFSPSATARTACASVTSEDDVPRCFARCGGLSHTERYEVHLSRFRFSL
jgi:hypothetical protein